MAEKPLHDNPERGWGMYLGEFLREGTRIGNNAKNGRSTRSFIAQGLWDEVYRKLKPGDYVLIQFGHNDSKQTDSLRYAAPWDAYKKNLEYFIGSAKAKGAVPVLLTPLCRRKFGGSGEFIDQHGDYPKVVRAVAEEKKVPLIDAHAQSCSLLTRLGPLKSRNLFLFIPPNLWQPLKGGKTDNTHFSRYGARVFARMIAVELSRYFPSLGYVNMDASPLPAFEQWRDWGYDFTVSADGTGDFTTVQDAIDAVPEHAKRFYTVYIRKGEYRQKLFINKNNIRLVGESRDSVKIIFSELRKNWRQVHPDDYGAAVVNIKNGVENIILSNLTIANDYGRMYGNHDHQFAIRGGGTRIIIIDCSIIADGGDTVSLWNGKDGMYFHRNCYFEGHVDFVCPRGWCYIDSSRFFARNLTAAIWMDGDMDQTQKFVMKHCRFDGIEGFPLGRHHREAAFYLLDCSFSEAMADKPISYVGPGTPKWPSRYYFANCTRDGGNYTWFQDNFPDSPWGRDSGNITVSAVFNRKWDPEKVLYTVNDHEIP